MYYDIGLFGIMKGYTNYMIRNFIFCALAYGIYE